MKELSIEEKAKRYDEAKLRMSAAYNSNRCTIGFMNEIFPELAESDDERMRKALIKLVKKVGEGYENVIDGISIENAIAWLEKQGEQKPVPDWMPKFLDELRSKKNYFDWDEHKDIEGGILAIINWMNPNYFNEKDGKQKANKVEPKFKIGQTIKKEGFNSGFTIVNIEDGFYYNDMGSNFPLTDQDNWELVEQNPDEDRYMEGYLNRINDTLKTQKPAVWNEEDEAIYYGVIETEQYMLDVVNGVKKFAVGDTSIKEECTRELNWLKSLKDKVGCEVNCTTTKEWSEEDEINLKYTTRIIERLYDKQEKNYLKESLEGKLNWLKSLKDRVQPQPKQEWSEEDIVAIDCAVDVLNKDLPTLAASIKRLKSLRPQNHWKPSEEQMDALRQVISGCSYDIEPLVEIEEYLKKLKE